MSSDDDPNEFGTSTDLSLVEWCEGFPHDAADLIKSHQAHIAELEAMGMPTPEDIGMIRTEAVFTLDGVEVHRMRNLWRFPDEQG